MELYQNSPGTETGWKRKWRFASECEGASRKERSSRAISGTESPGAISCYLCFVQYTDFAIPFMVFAGPMYNMGTKKFRDKARVGMTTN